MKSNLLQIWLVLISLSLINFSCGSEDKNSSYRMQVENHSTKPIGIYVATGGNFGTTYPDTLPPTQPNYIVAKRDPGKAYYNDTSLGWANVIRSLPKDTVSVFIFDADTLAKYPLDIIRKQYKVLKRYDLSLNNLNRLGWIVPYPATEDMKNMKMFPPYP